MTREAHVTSSNTETMAVEDSPAGPVAVGLRRGESTLLVRYEGQFATAPATVLSGRAGFEWTALRQVNYIDELIDEKLRRTEVLPSEPVDDAAFLLRRRPSGAAFAGRSVRGGTPRLRAWRLSGPSVEPGCGEAGVLQVFEAWMRKLSVVTDDSSVAHEYRQDPSAHRPNSRLNQPTL